eukprot:INCI12836.2.p1 GENE.INCI12836.2~~INCI12836.2.p1  ORF type:complete len:552 (+),score=82.26 INCI12836.2:236-1891(+)
MSSDIRARRGADNSPLFPRPSPSKSPKFSSRGGTRGRPCGGGSTTLKLALAALAVCVALVVLQLLWAQAWESGDQPAGSNAKPLTSADAHRSVVVDAGSSGTRIYAFEFSDADVSSIRQLFSLRLKPGLSDCYRRLSNRSSSSAGESASDKLAFDCAFNQTSELLHSLLEAHVGFEAGHVSSIPVYVRATAGLRLLAPHERSVLLQAAEKAVTDARFAEADYEGQRPRVASGTEEAVYDWLAVNVAKLGLDQVQIALRSGRRRASASQNTAVVSSDQQPAAASALLGVMDLGGASTQIVFSDPTSRVDSAEDEASECQELQFLRGLGKLSLYAVSRLGYGHNEMFSTVQQEWARHVTSVSTASGTGNPCLFHGAHVDEKGQDTGAGDFAACRGFISRFLVSEAEKMAPCWRRKVPRGLEFVGMDHFVKIAKLLFPQSFPVMRTAAIATSTGDTVVIKPTLLEFATRGTELCAASWTEVQERNTAVPGGKPLADDALHKACFLAAYVHALLVDLYGFEPESQRVQFSDYVGPVAANWALGSALFEFLSKEPI